MARSIPPSSRGSDDCAPPDLEPWLRTAALGRSRSYHAVIGSTQDEARTLAGAGAPHGHLVWAGEQTAGRGRLERRWHSAAAAGLWFSVLLRPVRPARAVGALPLAVGVASAEALARHTGGEVGLKWPNDVLLDGRKVAGILVEAVVEAGVLEHAVVGVGINLVAPEGGFPTEIAGTAAALTVPGAGPSPAQLLAEVLGELERRYVELLAVGPEPARRAWLDRSATIGRRVTALVGAIPVTGTAVDLDAEGNLVVDVDGDRVVVSYGEVQLLRAAPG